MITEKKVKTVLQASKLPESPFCLNPYVGCTHRCAYCYARFMRRFTGHTDEPWGSFVDVKINLRETLRRQLDRKLPSGPVLIGSVCDAYQPIEKKYELTRSAVELFLERGVRFSILTKGELVLRDLDLFRQAGDRCSVGVSLGVLDACLATIFEPGASLPDSRIRVLRSLHEAGIHTYAFIGPILPGVSTVRDTILAVAQDVDELWGEALNTSCGNVPDLMEAYRTAGLGDHWLEQAKSVEYWKAVEDETVELTHQVKRPLIGFFRHRRS